MNISNNLRQLRFMNVAGQKDSKKRETLGTWMLQEIKRRKGGKQGDRAKKIFTKGEFI